MTMIVATHEMGFAREVADEVCFLDGGRVLERGPPEQVLGDPARAADPSVPPPDHRGRPALTLVRPASGDRKPSVTGAHQVTERQVTGSRIR